MLPKNNILNGFSPFNINKNTEYLILGSFPSVKSLEGDFYYLHPQNRFYKILAEIFEEQLPFSIEDKKAFLVKHNIGLWDIIKSCQREGSLDSNIKDIEINDLNNIDNIKQLKIGCTGKKSFELTKKYFPDLNVYYLSSPSSANVKYFDIDTWKIFFNK